MIVDSSRSPDLAVGEFLLFFHLKKEKKEKYVDIFFLTEDEPHQRPRSSALKVGG